MFSVRKPAYHGIGNIVDAPVGSKEAQKLAGLDWNVQMNDLFASANGYLTRSNGQKAIVRDDTHEFLGIVGNDYTPVQNSELFDFARDLGEFDDSLHVETAGAIKGGAIVWCLVRMDAMRISLGNDVVDAYLLLVNGHIGNRRFSAFPTTVRPVCMNSLRAADKERKNSGLSLGWDLKHTASIQGRLQEAKAALGKMTRDFQATRDDLTRMADVATPDGFLDDLIAATFGPAPKEGKGATIAENRATQIWENLQSPTCKGLDTEGTIWSALNALTEYVDHQSVIRPRDYTAEESRFLTGFLNDKAGAQKETAYAYALKVATA